MGKKEEKKEITIDQRIESLQQQMINAQTLTLKCEGAIEVLMQVKKESENADNKED